MEKSVINVEKCIGQINAMSKTDFHQKILRGVAASEEFSCLVSIDIKYLTTYMRHVDAGRDSVRILRGSGF